MPREIDHIDFRLAGMVGVHTLTSHTVMDRQRGHRLAAFIVTQRLVRHPIVLCRHLHYLGR